MDGNRSRNAEESRRILDRVARESDPSGSLAVRTARRVERHLRADDADQQDRIELWGTRIGRVIGTIALVLLGLWLISYITTG